MYRAYEYLATVAVFLEQVRIDEIMYEFNIKDEDKGFASRILEIEEQGVYWLLCQLQISLHAHGLPVDTDVTRDVMAKEFRDLNNRAVRHNRDYIILRDFGKVLNYIRAEFASLAETAQDEFKLLKRKKKK